MFDVFLFYVAFAILGFGVLKNKKFGAFLFLNFSQKTPLFSAFGGVKFPFRRCIISFSLRRGSDKFSAPTASPLSAVFSFLVERGENEFF